MQYEVTFLKVYAKSQKCTQAELRPIYLSRCLADVSWTFIKTSQQWQFPPRSRTEDASST